MLILIIILLLVLAAGAGTMAEPLGLRWGRGIGLGTILLFSW